LRPTGRADTKAALERSGRRMHAILNFAEYIVQGLLGLILWVVIAYAVLGWLIAFNVVNMRNSFVWRLSRFLEAVAQPMLAPFQRLLPNMGGIDFSPILLFLVIGGVRQYLIPPFFGFLHSLVPGGAAVI
jgi:YggT family protein